MKTLILCILLALLFAGNKNEQNAYTEHNLKGKVRSIYESFDFDRQRISEHWPDSGKGSVELIYDAKGYVARETHFKYKSHDSIDDVIYYNYDSLGNKIEYHWREGNTERYNFSYENDSKGRRIVSIQYDSLKRVLRREEYKYDSKDNKTETDVFKSDGSPNGKSIDKYDTQNNRIETATYRNSGKLREKVSYDYDNDGNNTEERHYNSDGAMVEKISSKYDGSGNVIEINGVRPLKNYTWSCKMTYDAYNNVITRNCTYSDHKKNIDYSYNYDYDKTGNWLKESIFIDDTLFAKYSKEITYY